MKACIDECQPNTSQANYSEGFWRITSKTNAKIKVRRHLESGHANRRSPNSVPDVLEKAETQGHRRKSPWVPTLTGPFLNGQENAGSWLGTKNALYYCAQLANSISWVLFVSSYTTALTRSRLVWLQQRNARSQESFSLTVTATFQNTGSPRMACL